MLFVAIGLRSTNSVRLRKSPDPSSTVAVSDVAVAAARAGVPVEVTQKLAPVDEWTRVAQVALAGAAIISFGMFIVFAIGEDGLRRSSITTTSTAKTGGKAGQAVTRTKTDTTVTPAARAGVVSPATPGPRGTTTNTEVVERVTAPRTRVKVAEQTRPSDTITGLMGGLAVVFFLVAATLPRLRTLEFQGLKLGLAGDSEPELQAVELTGVKLVEAVAEVVTAPTLRRLVGDDVVITALAREQDVVLIDDQDAVRQWAEEAFAETLRRARAEKFEAALAGGDPAKATLSEADIEEIVRRTRPRSLS